MEVLETKVQNEKTVFVRYKSNGAEYSQNVNVDSTVAKLNQLAKQKAKYEERKNTNEVARCEYLISKFGGLLDAAQNALAGEPEEADVEVEAWDEGTEPEEADAEALNE